MDKIKKIGLVAHDARKQDMLDWVRFNAISLAPHKLICTGTTGRLIAEMFEDEFPELSPDVTRLKSGPLGGDQQMGALIAGDELDILIFLTDPMTTQPHDVDVKALVRLCTVYNTVIACNKSTADFIISSHLFKESYDPIVHDYSRYLTREAFGKTKKNTGDDI
ncbi:MAG: methylglyoxal synthase [Synergistaceae bacterium]|jgi:methylglyoxal synthase|nr:methylglyoxal synthase [Synergistaceae bacterium]